MSGFPVEFLNLQSRALRRQHGSCCVAGVEAGEVGRDGSERCVDLAFLRRLKLAPTEVMAIISLLASGSLSKKPPRRQRDYFCSIGRYHWLQSMTKLRH